MAVLSLVPTASQLTSPARVVDPHLVLRREPCACGAEVVQMFGEDPGTAVQRHQRLPEHELWRAASEDTPQGGCTPTAGPSPVDLSSAPPVRSVPALRAVGRP